MIERAAFAEKRRGLLSLFASALRTITYRFKSNLQSINPEATFPLTDDSVSKLFQFTVLFEVAMFKSIVCASGLVLLSMQPQARANPAELDEREVLFEDDFDDVELDRTKWNVVGPEFWVNNEQQAYVDSPDTIHFREDESENGESDGVLVLQPLFRKTSVTAPNRKAEFVSGRINSRGKFDFTYGRAAARIRMPDAVGVWPAFWLLGNGSWPETGEIDILEYVGEKDWIGVALHGPGYSGETPLVNKYVFEPGTDATDWHEYAIEWTKDQILFEVDGRLIYRVTRPMVDFYGEWKFDTPKFLIVNFAVGGVYPFKTNGIAKPYYGVPAETVASIKRGDITMEVDWVRVYAPIED